MRKPVDKPNNRAVSTRSRHLRHPRHRAFTLLEVLTVIGIIAVLVTLVVLGVGHIGKMGREKTTQTVMENLKGIVQEKEIAGGLSEIGALFANNPPVTLNPMPAPGDVRTPAGRAVAFKAPVTPGGAYEPQNVMAAELMVMQKLMSVPANRQKIANFTSNQLLATSSIPGNVPPGYTAPFVLDAWGNPMIYVPAGNKLSGVFTSGGSRIQPIDVVAPDGRGFWASAGPDGIFGRGAGHNMTFDTGPTFGDDIPGGDDNLYSFQN